MPRFFFHVKDGQDILDETGTELPDAEAARRAAAKASGEAFQDLGDKFWDNHDWHMFVTDEQGQEVARLNFSGQATGRRDVQMAPAGQSTMTMPTTTAAALLVSIASIGLPLDGWSGVISTVQAQSAALNEQSDASNYVPLEAIYQAVRTMTDGEIINAELLDDGGRPSYRITVLAADGKVNRFFFDAVTGTRL